MGFLSSLFGGKDNTVNSDLLIKQASILKKEGEYNLAIKKLLEAFNANGYETFHIDTLLRLPLYYKLAGNMDEAWISLSKIESLFFIPPIHLGQQFDNKSFLKILAQIKINDKMRLHLQNEGSFLGAVPYGIYTQLLYIITQNNLLNDMKETHPGYKNLKKQYDEITSGESFLELINMLLKKTGAESQNKILLKSIVELLFSKSHISYSIIHDLCKEILIEIINQDVLDKIAEGEFKRKKELRKEKS